MNKIKSVLLSASAMFCTSLLSSCVPSLEEPLPPSESSSSRLPLSSSFIELSSSSALPQGSSSAGESIKYCVYSEIRQCFSTSQTTCPAGGELSDFCPYVSSSSVVSSSSSAVASSSSVAIPSSSSFAVASSSSSKPSSSSSVPPSSSSVPSSSSELIQAGIVYGPSVTYEGETYKTVVIGTQTWFQRNLNYAVTGSKCRALVEYEYAKDENTVNCDKYGRLYSWATAMALPDSCNTSKNSTSTCASQVGAKHRGICPSGWHIPSYAEWNKLKDFGISNLKATSGWSKNNNGTDDYGFAALPGGFCFESGSCSVPNGDNVIEGGYWWSSINGGSSCYAYVQSIGGNWCFYGNGMAGFSSVRCLKD
ncbi:MAG: hypothetical protein LBC87_04220 [Fibromonadaceae bacterium]|nr:hypothetical protein [Fibromonadaceae bacterium]